MQGEETRGKSRSHRVLLPTWKHWQETTANGEIQCLTRVTSYLTIGLSSP